MAINSQSEDQPTMRPRRLRSPYLLAFTFVFGLGAGMLFDRWSLMAFVPSDAVTNFRLIAEAWNTIERYYVDRAALDPQKLTYGAISGMVDALGDTGHSVFLTPGMVSQLESTERGELKGVGVHIKIKDKQMVIVAPIDGSPAQRAGLRSGEIILSVDGRDIAGMSPGDAAQQISGPAGSSVELGILDPKTHKVRDVTIVRAEIKLHDVSWVQLPGTDFAYVRLAGFDEGVTKDLRAALRQVQQQHLKGLILDMRDNPGGILDEAVSTASQFLSIGNVLLVRDANGEIKPEAVQPGGLATNIPLVVMINNGSASAAEIVAGALGIPQNGRPARGVLVGDQTFGTGTVLNEFGLPGGSAMLLAVQEWLTPDGKSFWHKGIPPQISVELPQGADRVEVGDLREMSADELQASDDAQLLKAIQVLGQEVNTGAGK